MIWEKDIPYGREFSLPLTKYFIILLIVINLYCYPFLSVPILLKVFELSVLELDPGIILQGEEILFNFIGNIRGKMRID